MKPYTSLLRVRFLNGLQYRAAAFGGLATQLFWAIMLVFLFKAFYGGASSSNGFTYKDLVSLVWLQQAFFALIFLFDYDMELAEMITSGGITYELCRPVNVYWLWYSKTLSKRLVNGLMRFLPIVVIGFVMPSPYNLSLPESPLSLLLFLSAMVFASLLTVAIVMIVYISIFKTMSPIGSMAIFYIPGEFFSGGTIPIPLMPLWLQKVCMVLPFRWTSDFPVRVYSGNIGTHDALIGIAVQIFWIAVLILIGELIMRRITRLTVVQGG